MAQARIMHFCPSTVVCNCGDDEYVWEILDGPGDSVDMSCVTFYKATGEPTKPDSDQEYTITRKDIVECLDRLAIPEMLAEELWDAYARLDPNRLKWAKVSPHMRDHFLDSVEAVVSSRICHFYKLLAKNEIRGEFDDGQDTEPMGFAIVPPGPVSNQHPQVGWAGLPPSAFHGGANASPMNQCYMCNASTDDQGKPPVCKTCKWGPP